MSALKDKTSSDMPGPIGNHEPDTETMSELADDMALCMTMSTPVTGQKNAIGTKEGPHEGHAVTALARSAVSKALHTTEILELILSHLPVFDLTTAANANDLFYNCAVNSPDMQQTLFLRSGVKTPPQCYRVHRSWMGSQGWEVRTTTLGLTPSAGMASDDTRQWAEACNAVRPCPALRLNDHDITRENRATSTGALRKVGLHGNEKLSFIAGPNEIGRVDMFISDPPTHSASILLCYKHVETSSTICIHYTSARDVPLTFPAIFEGARTATNGFISFTEKQASKSGSLSKRLYKGALDAVTSEYLEIHGGSFELDLKNCSIKLNNAIVPTEEEWETMRQVLAEEEEKKKKMDPDVHAAWMVQLLGEM